VVVGVVLLAVVALALVRRIRRAISDRVRAWWPEVREAVRGLRASNKLGLLIGGSIATEILFAVALGVFANALGYDIGLADLLLINISVSLLASFVPVPGGIGVAEFGLTVGLVAAGMPDEVALATAVLYRVATFYLPPLWGFFAMRWLQRNSLLRPGSSPPAASPRRTRCVRSSTRRTSATGGSRTARPPTSTPRFATRRRTASGSPSSRRAAPCTRSATQRTSSR
jgi:hypothetical protein